MAETGRALDLGGPKQRALLAVLLLHAGEVVSQDRLIDALWEDDPPETAQKALQVHVSSLRKLLGRERLETAAPGYRLRLEEGELDLERFQRLRAQGKPQEALALWRGPPLADLADSRFAQAEIARLEELRLACLEERIEHDLQAGRHAELVPELEALVQAHPLRERLQAQRMLSLYRCARQAEALEAYQEARRALTEELGLEPGRELRELQQAMLNQDAGLEQARVEPEIETATAVEALPEAEPGAREARKTVTVLSASVAASTAGGEQLDPEALRRVRAQALERIQRAVERHGGAIDVVAGGGVTAMFGVPAVHEDDARRALRASLELVSRIDELTAELRESLGVFVQVRVGVSTGEVVVGGSLQPAGEPLTCAHRLSDDAQPGEVLLDEVTHRLVRDVTAVEAVPAGLRLVGFSDEVAGAGRLRSPMVGRARERRRLHDAFDQAVGDRSCQLFTVLGAAGVGKSRLVEEFLGDVSAEALAIRGRCLPYGEGITYWPVLEAVKEAVGLEDSDSPEEARAKLAAALEDDADAGRLAEMLGLAEGSLGVEEGFSAVRALVEALARERSLVVVFDDIHWAEPTFLDLVEHLSDWTRGVPMLLLCLARPELLDVRPGWAGGKLNATTILLEPLSEDESAELVRNLAGLALDEPTRLRIVGAAEGNPLFVEEMLALALERGSASEELVVPPTIQALLAARLDGLTESERTTIECASVEGKVFSEGAVAELAPAALRPELPSLLGALLRKELIRPDRASLGGRTYGFRHLLIRDAAYDSIPKEARADMHERFGRWLERAARERAVEYEEILGYHFEQACRYRAALSPMDEAAGRLGKEAAERLGAAGRRAFVRSDARAGMKLISRAVSLLPPDDPLRVELVPAVRVVQGVAEDVSWADQVLTEAIEVAATSGDRRLAAHALVQRGLLRLFTGPEITAQELIEAAERAIAVFEEYGDQLGLARAWRLMAQAHYLRRRAGLCAEASEQALACARLGGDLFEEREIVEWLVISLFLGPAPAAEAARRCRALLQESGGDPVLEVQILGTLAGLEAIQGHLDKADELAAQVRNAMNELGEGIWMVSFWLSFGYGARGDWMSAERQLRPDLEAFEKLGEKRHLNSICGLLADAVYEQGRYDEAEEFTRQCERAARPNDVHSQIMWRATRAKVLARRGAFEAAEALANEAVAFAAEGDFLVARADALMDLGEVLELAGRAEPAASAFREALGFYERKGNVLATESARRRLAALRS